MTKKTSSYRQSLLTSLSNPVEADAYLSAATGDSPDASRKAHKNVTEARQLIPTLWGAMRGAVTVASGADLTEPAGEDWDSEQ